MLGLILTLAALGCGGSEAVEEAESDGAATAPTCGGLPATIVADTRCILGTPGPDVIVGGPGPNTILGLGGGDVICGRGGDDTVFGGSGDDTLFGQSGRDTLLGGSGHDSLGPGADTEADYIYGDGGVDEVLSTGPNDLCDTTADDTRCVPELQAELRLLLVLHIVAKYTEQGCLLDPGAE